MLVQTLFVASCLLSIVSFYTTQQGMALYLSPWFATLASLGIQTALVMVAWLVGIERRKSALHIAVYGITATLSIAFSYVSLYNWFAARERPALVQRALHDELQVIGGKAEGVLAEAAVQARAHSTAIEEMAVAEREHGHISRGQDADPFLNQVREAVAAEARSMGTAYKEGTGAGVRYTAFERHARLARQRLAEIENARRDLAAVRADLTPGMPTAEQLRRFSRVYDAVPWPAAEQVLARTNIERPALPAFANYVDKSATDQEDLMRAFDELFRAPTSRHVFSFSLAAFIDIIVFLVAFASGPYLKGLPEQRWTRAGAVLDDAAEQVFVKSLLTKVRTGAGGLAEVDAGQLSPGERQVCLALAARGRAIVLERDGKTWFVLEREVHEQWLESISERGPELRAQGSMLRREASTGSQTI